CVEGGVANEVRYLAVIFVAARLHGEVGCSCALILSRRRAGDHLKLIDGVHAHALRHQTVVALLVDGFGRHSVEIELTKIVGGTPDDRQPSSILRAWRECRKRSGVALRIVHLQRQGSIRRIFDNHSDRCVRCIEDWRRRSYDHCLGGLTECKNRIETQLAKSNHVKVLLRKFLEALRRHRDRVRAREQRCYVVRSRTGGRTGGSSVGCRIGRGDCRVRNRRSRRIRYRSRNASFAGGLRMYPQRSGYECKQHKKIKRLSDIDNWKMNEAV